LPTSLGWQKPGGCIVYSSSPLYLLMLRFLKAS
jgi:hypothetical protein